MNVLGSAGRVALVGALFSVSAPGQSSWRLYLGTVNPEPRAYSAMAYMPTRGVTVLFGGTTFNLATGDFNNTWEWDGQSWTLRAPPMAPPPRYEHAMVYDPQHNCILIFGGGTVFQVMLGDTWTYDGTTWLQRNPPASPAPRQGSGIASDPATGSILLFGGRPTYTAPPLGDTWSWNGQTWVQLFPTHSPSARFGHAMVGDPLRRRVILWGGGTLTTPTNETWVWDGADWSHLQDHFNPSLDNGQFAYDSARGSAFKMEFLGNYPPRIGSCYLENVWYGCDPYPRPSNLLSRHAPCLAYDEMRDEVILFGGWDDFNGYTQYFGATWLYRPANKSYRIPVGAGCPGALGIPELITSYAGTGTSGVNWRLTAINVPGYALVTLGFRGDSWNGTPLPLDLAAFGMPGCAALVQPDHIVAATASGGTAIIAMRLPADPSLYNLDIHAQAVAASPGSNQLGAVVSNAVITRIGRW